MKDKNLASNENADIIQELEKELLAIIDEADETLKAQERLADPESLSDQKVLVSVLNELRSVAGWWSQVLRNQGNRDKTESNLREAIAHSRRAIFDSLEMQAQHYLDTCDKFTKELTLANVPSTEVLQSYPDDKTIVDDIREKLPNLICAGEKRSEHCKEIASHIPTLKKISQKWNNTRPALNQKIENEQCTQRRFVVQCLLIIVVPIIVAVLTIVWNQSNQSPPTDTETQVLSLSCPSRHGCFNSWIEMLFRPTN